MSEENKSISVLCSWPVTWWRHLCSIKITQAMLKPTPLKNLPITSAFLLQAILWWRLFAFRVWTMIWVRNRRFRCTCTLSYLNRVWKAQQSMAGGSTISVKASWVFSRQDRLYPGTILLTSQIVLVGSTGVIIKKPRVNLLLLGWRTLRWRFARQ